MTASPEPFSNAALSLGEDGLAIFLTWFATRHPYSAAAIVAGAITMATGTGGRSEVELKPGDRAPEFELPGSDGRNASLGVRHLLSEIRQCREFF